MALRWDNVENTAWLKSHEIGENETDCGGGGRREGVFRSKGSAPIQPLCLRHTSVGDRGRAERTVKVPAHGL